MTDREFLLRVSVLEIYNDQVYDLLSEKNDDLKLMDDHVSLLCIFNLFIFYFHKLFLLQLYKYAPYYFN